LNARLIAIGVIAAIVAAVVVGIITSTNNNNQNTTAPLQYVEPKLGPKDEIIEIEAKEMFTKLWQGETKNITEKVVVIKNAKISQMSNIVIVVKEDLNYNCCWLYLNVVSDELRRKIDALAPYPGGIIENKIADIKARLYKVGDTNLIRESFYGEALDIKIK
jgi:uncharacterized membrane protein YraQ (UPF0718 family)